MKNTKILEMINNGQIEKLKVLLQDEIYKESLQGNSDVKKRYAAMKRYFKYSENTNLALNMPCNNVEVHGDIYNSFIDGYSLVLTKESVGNLETYDNSENTYFKLNPLVDFSIIKSVEKFDLNKIIAEAKSKGYKYKKSEIGNGNNFQYVFKYKDGYFKVGILDQAFSIVNDGEEAEVYYTNAKSLLMIKTNIGIAGISPFSPIENIESKKTVIKTER